jgi:uncharacterized protein YegL
MTTKHNFNRKGAFAVLFAVLLPILMIFLGFSVDYSHMQRTRNELRTIADLSAKSSAAALARTDGDEAVAWATAVEVALSNEVSGKPLTLQPDDVIFGRSTRTGEQWSFTPGLKPANAVQVVANRKNNSPEGPIPLFFGRFYGQSGFEAVQTATASFVDVDIMLVLDRSGSMTQPINGADGTSVTRWQALDEAVTLFIDKLDATPARERVGLVTFSDSATLDSTLNSDMSLLRDAMEDLNNAGQAGTTNIFDGLTRTRQHMNGFSPPNRSRYVILLTDGSYNTGGNPAPVATQCGDDNIIINTITFSDEANQADMEIVADEAGGGHFHAPDGDTLEAIFERLAGTFAVLSE